MRRLMLLRHAKSDWPDGVDDHERWLAERGRRVSPLIGRYMADNALVPDLAIVSTARRTRETWDLVRTAFLEAVVHRLEPRMYDAPASSILNVIHETAPEVHTLLLVGHNPGLQNLALDLIGTANQQDLVRLQGKYPTAGLVVIDFDIQHWSEVSRRTGRLDRFETPRSLP